MRPLIVLTIYNNTNIIVSLRTFHSIHPDIEKQEWRGIQSINNRLIHNNNNNNNYTMMVSTHANTTLSLSSSSLAKTTTARIIASILLVCSMLLSPTKLTTVQAFSSSGSSSNIRHHASTNNYWSLRQRHNNRSPSSASQQPLLLLPKFHHNNNNNNKRSTISSSTSLNLLGSDSGLLGVGAPEVAVILLVGYFILGPSELYKLVKEIGKFIQNIRTLGTEAAKSFEGTMEDQLELKELRKAQSELNEAFGFRRSINTSEFRDAFDRTGATVATTTATAATTAATGGLDSSTDSGGGTIMAGDDEKSSDAPKRKRRLVRRKKKVVVDETNEMDVPSSESERGGYPNTSFALEYPDLDMLDSAADFESNSDNDDDLLLRAQRLERLQQSSTATTETASITSNEEQEKEDNNMMDWFTASEEDIASKILNQSDNNDNVFEKQRSQSQLSADEWNAQIMAREDELSPCKWRDPIELHLTL